MLLDCMEIIGVWNVMIHFMNELDPPAWLILALKCNTQPQIFKK